jgi:Zn-dependent protease
MAANANRAPARSLCPNSGAQLIPLLAALALMFGTWAILRGGFVLAGQRGLQFAGFDPTALGLGALAVIVAIAYFGWLYGAALILSVVLHEFGHVAAYRVCGHDDARFRLIPILGGVAISNRLPATQGNAFFIALMGPAICLAPMALCFALSDLLATTSSPLSGFLFVFAIVLAVFNFFNLLPFWPLDGGRMVQILAQSFLPGATRQVSIAMIVIGATLAYLGGAYILLLLLLISWGGLMQSERVLTVQRPMTRPRALLALAAYGCTAGAFFLGGSLLLQGMF